MLGIVDDNDNDTFDLVDLNSDVNIVDDDNIDGDGDDKFELILFGFGK